MRKHGQRPEVQAEVQVQVQDPGLVQAVRFSFARQEPDTTVISPRRPVYSILHHALGLFYPQGPEVGQKIHVVGIVYLSGLS